MTWDFLQARINNNQKTSPSVRRETTVDDHIRGGYGVVGETVKAVVHLRDPFLHPLDIRLQIAQAVLVGGASFNACQRDDGVVKNPADVRWRCRGRAGEELRDEVRGERRDVADFPLLCLLRVCAGGLPCDGECVE